jgi:hypothetical protein
VLKKLSIILLAIALLVIPTVGRWFAYYNGRYQPGQVNRPDLDQIKPSLLEAQPFEDQEIDTTPGTVLVDLAHENRVQMAELNVLQARLSARGQRFEPITQAEDLGNKLRYARALVIMSPGVDWAPDEIQLVQRFVDKGGRLLLIADPTRFEAIYDEWDVYVGLDYDAPHLNDLAARFGLVFQTDYLYNTFENEGNFRNIGLTEFADDPLTAGLERIVFFAAHSLVSEEPALIIAGGETRSSTSEQAEDLVVGLLAADGAVLALGDLTFMTEPNNAVYDNAQFIANIADFVSQAQRRYELADFPHFFGEEVDLVYTGSPLLDSKLVKGGSNLQALLKREGKALDVRAEEDDARDTLFIGLYEKAEEVQPYLEAAQVTLLISPTQPLTATSPVTPTAETEPEGATERPTEGESPTADTNRIAIEPLGEMAMAGTTLLLRQTDGAREVMVVLVNTEEGLESAVDRLTGGDLTGCLLHEAGTTLTTHLALCPTEETAPREKDSGKVEPPADQAPPDSEAPPPEESVEPSSTTPLGSILIVALDEGEGRYEGITSADDYTAILQDQYELAFWSTAQDGVPDLQAMLDFDLVIWTAGDFEIGANQQYGDLVFSLLLEGVPVIMSGAYVGDTETEALQRDIQVFDATHPLAVGFEADEVIDFVTSPSGQEYVIGVLEGYQDEKGTVAFARGPASEEDGLPSIITMGDELSDFRLVFIGFPLYLLPESPKEQLVLNAISWLLGPRG